MRETLTRARAYEESENVGSNPTDNPTIGDVIAARLGRRDILKGALGVAAMAATVSPLALASASRAQAPHERVALPLRRDRGRHRPEPSRGGGLRRRHPDPLGRPGGRGRAGIRTDEADRRRAAPAVRLQLRLHRLLPDAGRGQSVASRPAHREPRIHQRRADVPRPQAPGRQGRDVRRHDRGAGRHRDGRAWRRGDRDPPRERQVAGRRQFEIRPPHRCRRRRWRSPDRPRGIRGCRPRPIRAAAARSACSTTAPAA